MGGNEVRRLLLKTGDRCRVTGARKIRINFVLNCSTNLKAKTLILSGCDRARDRLTLLYSSRRKAVD